MSADQELGFLAYAWRGEEDSNERTKIVNLYAQAVFELIEAGTWCEVPPPDHWLPDELMPKEFFEYWGLPTPNNYKGNANG